MDSIHHFTHILIGISYIVISITLWRIAMEADLPFNKVIISFGVFITACAFTHFTAAFEDQKYSIWPTLAVNIITMMASALTAIYLIFLKPGIIILAQNSKLAEIRRKELEILTKELEERVERRTADLQAALSGRDEFILIASHELKTPITSLLMQSQLQNKYIEKNDPKAFSKDQIIKINNQNEELAIHLNTIVDNMLEISRIRYGQLVLSKQGYDLKLIIEEVLNKMKPIFIRSGYIVPQVIGHGINGEWDITRIKHVAYNLLSNAIKYGQGNPIEIMLTKTQKGARIEITDHGIGIPKEDQKSIFERYERAVERQEISGLGLGLFISKKIVEAHAGEIWVECRDERCTTFIVELPISTL